MNKKTENFISTYKDLERILREDNIMVLDFENTLPNDDADKLRICRQIRNYIQHHPDDFLSATEEMTDFVKKIIKEVGAKKEKVKDKTTRIKAVADSDKLEDVINFFNKQRKYNICPIVNKDGYLTGVITPNNLIYALSLNSVKKKVREVKCVSKTPIVAHYNDDLAGFNIGDDIVVVKDHDIKYVGMIKW